MRFSIVTVTLNAEKYLEHCLRSVASQDLRSFEQILWDGGSSDRTLEIARSFRHVVVHQGVDLGIGDAMNQAAALAKGEFLLFLHADDLLAHRTVLHEVDTFLNANPDALWAFGRTEIIGADGRPLRVPPFTPFDNKLMRRYNIIPHQASFVSRELFRRARGFRTDLRYMASYELWLRLATLTQPLAMQTVVAKHRQHPESLSYRERLQAADEAYQVRAEYTHSYLERRRARRRYQAWRDALAAGSAEQRH